MSTECGTYEQQGESLSSLTGRLTIGSDEDLVRLNDAAWKILERTGFMIRSRRLLEKVRDLGASVDEGAMVARFPRSVLEETLDCRLRDEPGAGPIEIPEVYGAGFGEQCFFFTTGPPANACLRRSSRQWT